MNESNTSSRAEMDGRSEPTIRVVRDADDAIATDIAVAIADAKGQDPMDIQPLGNVVDCEALNALVSTADESLSISFSYESFDVFVTSDGRVEVTTDTDPLHGD